MCVMWPTIFVFSYKLLAILSQYLVTNQKLACYSVTEEAGYLASLNGCVSAFWLPAHYKSQLLAAA